MKGKGDSQGVMQMLTKTLIGAHSVLAIASTTFAAVVRHTGRCL